ncbi:MAG: GNAT family N-acetyltransferase [bacterium]|nr:GNAT family N-acetyltransferase [bacterium]
MEEALIEELIGTCGLGKIHGDIEPVSGGLMHKMYKVATDSGVYAVKHLNAEIMKRPDARENYERAERLERRLENSDIPIVPAMEIGGNKMQRISDQFFYLFRWQEGRIADWNHISEDMCYKAGNILGRIHAIKPENTGHRAVEHQNTDWHGYVCKAKEEDSELAALLAEKEELLYYAESELNRARASLPELLCVSDEDMDPKNIMWENGQPRVIDLECLDYGNPVSCAVQLALQWAGIVTCELDADKLTAFFNGYLKAYDNCFRGYSDVTGVAYTWLEWLEYNIQRALGGCTDEAERNLGISEVRNTLDRIGYIHRMEPEIKEALNTRLRKPDVSRYDNHDDRICYYELLLERELCDVPEYRLPAGYRFAAYSDGDRDSWIAIEMSAKEFTDYEQGLDAWNRYYANCTEILPDRMFFVENEKGEKIATATAFYDIYGRDTSGAGWLHWVAVRREYQGRGLSKPLITHVLKIMKGLGYSHAKIPTQTNTWLACKVYLDLGFLPIRKNLEHSYEGWRIVKSLTGHPVLRDI